MKGEGCVQLPVWVPVLFIHKKEAPLRYEFGSGWRGFPMTLVITPHPLDTI